MTTSVLEDEFPALLCGDEEAVRAEFDAIIAANWAEPPVPPAPRRPVPRTSYRRVVHLSGDSGVATTPWARQRSPPGTGPR